MEFLRELFNTKSFMPHGHCYLWRPDLLWLHVASDAIITLAYASIPFALIYLVRKRKDLAFNWVFVMFGTFILACGATHAISIWTVWEPSYWFAGIVKALTAIASIGTAVALWPLLPKVLALPSPSQLEAANQGLQQEIIERKRIEADLEEKNRSLIAAEHLKSEFIANVSHELRTPLTLIVAPVESLQRSSANLNETQSTTLKTIHNNALRLLQMVNGLLDFSRLEAKQVELKREATDIDSLTRTILADFEPVIRGKNIGSNLLIETKHSSVHIDRYLYERILFNLLANAIKFTPEGGKISVNLNQMNDSLRLSVSDTGIGIADHDLKHLFQKFRQLEGSSTRRFEGTGLGLALVKEFTELLGGKVNVESQLGKGSIFTVDLLAPLANETSVQASRPVLRLVTDARSTLEKPAVNLNALPKVLIVEDNAELATYIASLLADFCQCDIVYDGNKALERVHSWQPDLVLSDVMMPERDGISLCNELKKNPATTRITVVLLTALTHREALVRGWEAGADEYLFKPFHPTELVTRVRSLLLGQQAKMQVAVQELELAQERAARAAVEEHIRKLKEIEQQLRRVNKVKDEFLAIVSHELRTPMNSIVGWTELLKNDQVESKEYGEIFEILYRNAKAQAKITEDLLDVSRIITGKLELNVKPVRLATVITDVVDSMHLAIESKQIEIILDIDDSSLVAGDQDRLSQVLWNLVANSLKFSPKGAKIWLTLRRVFSKIEIAIEDEGEGIEPSFLPHVFEKFLQENSSNTRRYGGLGLGLSIVKHIVEQHGGTVNVSSAGKGAGSTFTITLPVMSMRELNAEGHLDTSGTALTSALSGLHVLVVDDEIDSRLLVARILQNYGAKVSQAASADEALDKIQTQWPDLLISDLNMPEKDGYELMQQVKKLERESGKSLRALALTAHTGEQVSSEALAAGFAFHIAKPIETERLVLLIKDIFKNAKLTMNHH